jgi:hypothetical protein
MDTGTAEYLIKNLELIPCSNEFKCLEDGYAAIRMTRQFGTELFTCVSAEPWRCGHAIHYGYVYFCLCSAFIRIARDLKQGDWAEQGSLTGTVMPQPASA